MDNGGFAHEAAVATDAYNILLALANSRLKAPAEKNWLVHLLWLREKIERGVLTDLWWFDTRDMTADGHTKGSIRRNAIREVAAGSVTRQHPFKKLTEMLQTGWQNPSTVPAATNDDEGFNTLVLHMVDDMENQSSLL